MEVSVDVIEILHDANLIPVSTEEGYQFFFVHATEDRALADLKAIYMQNRQDSTRFFGIKVLDGMPGPGK